MHKNKCSPAFFCFYLECYFFYQFKGGFHWLLLVSFLDVLQTETSSFVVPTFPTMQHQSLDSDNAKAEITLNITDIKHITLLKQEKNTCMYVWEETDQVTCAALVRAVQVGACCSHSDSQGRIGMFAGYLTLSSRTFLDVCADSSRRWWW